MEYQNYDIGDRLIDYLRVTLGAESEYQGDEFKEHVDRYLGVGEAIFSNKVSNNFLEADASWEDDSVQDICQIKKLQR